MKLNRMAGLPQYLIGRHEVELMYGIQLADCPFCGGTPYLYASPSPHVVCGQCAASGPAIERGGREHQNEANNKALYGWNVRGRKQAPG